MKKIKKKIISAKNLLILILLLLVLFKGYSLFNNYFIDTHSTNTITNNIENEFNILLLVNNRNSLPSNYSISLVAFQNCLVAEILINDLQNMYNDAKNENINIEIVSAYRTNYEQQEIYNNRISNFNMVYWCHNYFTIFLI